MWGTGTPVCCGVGASHCTNFLEVYVQGCFSECYLKYPNSEPNLNNQLREWSIRISEVNWGSSIRLIAMASLKVFWWIFTVASADHSLLASQIHSLLLSSLLYGSGDWLPQTYHPGSLAFRPPVGFSQWEMQQEVREVEEREVSNSFSSSSLCFRVVPAVTGPLELQFLWGRPLSTALAHKWVSE